MFVSIFRDKMECTDQTEAEATSSKPSSIFHPNDVDINSLDLNEIKLIDALHDFMESHEDDVSNEVIADIIGSLESKYKSHIEASSIDDCLQLTKFTFEDETTESLIKAIRHFEPAANDFSEPQLNTRPLIIRCGDVVTEVGRDFFELKLRQTIDKMYQRPGDYAIDRSYLRILNICVNSRMAFRYFCEKLAQTMIDHQYPETVQAFLDQFIFDVRIRMNSIEDFCQMYSSDLYFYVRILTDSGLGSQTEPNAVVDSLLLNLRWKNHLKFVMLATQFKMARHLHTEMKNVKKSIKLK